jgi:predicted acetyltransferase
MNNFSYEIKIYETLPPEIEEQTKKLSEMCFFDETPEEEKKSEDSFFQIPKFLHLVAVMNNRVIGKMHLAKREITYRGKRLLLGGFCGVCTLPEFRRHGVASALIERAMKELKKTDCDVAYLCTNTDDPFLVRMYGRVGYRVLEKPHSYYGKSGTLYTDHNGMIAPIKSQKLFDEILKTGDTLHIGVGNW